MSGPVCCWTNLLKLIKCHCDSMLEYWMHLDCHSENTRWRLVKPCCEQYVRIARTHTLPGIHDNSCNVCACWRRELPSATTVVAAVDRVCRAYSCRERHITFYLHSGHLRRGPTKSLKAEEQDTPDTRTQELFGKTLLHNSNDYHELNQEGPIFRIPKTI